MTKKEEIICEMVHHFITDQWDIRTSKAKAQLVKKHCPYLTVTKAKKNEADDDRKYWVRRNKKKIPSDHLLLHYKAEAEMYQKEYDRLYYGMQELLK